MGAKGRPRILHPTDFSGCAEQARAEAIRLARALGAEVVLLHAFVETVLYGEGLTGMAEVERIYEAQRRWAAETLEARVADTRASGVPASARLRVGSPYEEIAQVAEEEGADLIVMGTHGRSGFRRLLLGSVADRVVRTAPCPVVTVRQPLPGEPPGR